MRGQTIAKAGVAVLFSLMLTACGGGSSIGSEGTTGGSSGSSSSSSGGSSSSSSSSGGTGGSSSSGGTVGSGIAQTLTLVSAQTQITADGTSTAEFTATLTDTTGLGIVGRALTFTTNAGTIKTSPVSTGSGGQAITYLQASTIAGLAAVTVRDPVSGLSTTTTITFAPGSAQNVVLTLAPSTVQPTTSTTAAALVTDTYGNAVTGEPVTFTATTNASGGSFNNITANTNTNGVASTTYTAGSNVGVDTLNAKTAGGQYGSANLTVSAAATLIGSISVTAGTTTAVADGSTQISLRAQVLSAATTPAGISGVTVSFTSTAGTFLQGINTATTDGNGNASVTLVAPRQPAVATITAKTAGFSNTTQVTFTAGPAASVSVSASPGQVPFGGSSSVQALVLDANGNPVPSASLTFGVSANNSGAGLNSTTATTNASGVGSVTYQAGTVSGNGAVTDTITATTPAPAPTNSVSGGTSIQVSSSYATVGSLSLSLAEPTFVAGSSSPVAVSATVKSSTGANVIGATVAFTTTGGSLSNPTAMTSSSGVATVYLTPPTAAGTVNVQASISGYTAQQTLTVTPGAASAVNSSITASPGTVIANGTSTSTVTVALNDAYGNPLPNGTSVTLLTSAGTLTGSGGNTQTLSSGETSFTLLAPTTPATATVSVQALPALATTVNFVSASSSTGVPASISLSTAPTAISVAGVGQPSTATITVKVTDSSGNPIKESNYPSGTNNLQLLFVAHPNGGETLSGQNAAGTVVSSTSAIQVATTNGLASITVQAGTNSGIVEIEAEVLAYGQTSFGSASNIAVTATAPQLSIASGPAATVAFTAPVTNSITNLGGGVYSRTGSVVVTDRYGNNVADGTVVNLALMDSVILQDSTGATTQGASTLTRSGNSLITYRCANPPPVAGGAVATGCATATSDFTSTIIRNGATRGIQQGDLVLISNTQSNDQKNTVSAVNSATQLTAIQNYNNTLSGLDFWVGSALLGGEIGGYVTAGNPQAGINKGTATTSGGIATFQVVYPANVNTILSGCYNYTSNNVYSTIDLRDTVPQSRQVVAVASAGTSATAISVGTFCFAAELPLQLLANVASVGGSGGGVILTLEDANDVPLPFVGGVCQVATNVNESITVTSGFVTGVNGTASISISAALAPGATSGSGSVICSADGASVTIGVSTTQ